MNVVSYLLVLLGYGKPPNYKDLDKDRPPTYEEAVKLVKPVAVVRPLREPRERENGRNSINGVNKQYYSFGRGRAQFREKDEKSINCTYNKKDFTYDY